MTGANTQKTRPGVGTCQAPYIFRVWAGIICEPDGHAFTLRAFVFIFPPPSPLNRRVLRMHRDAEGGEIVSLENPTAGARF